MSIPVCASSSKSTSQGVASSASGVIFLIPLAQVPLRLSFACWETLHQAFIRKTKVAPSPTSTAEDSSSIV
ncbi:hypothetical protein PanWU01x14_073650 [Parasponia andersonii]|uniref:Uncharacterized protein n=1 Tax=Parasponia andersonii TaxID=3476 RepID=A0A2P5DE70_PARAD|nr:hypothetical protein PanWU01x14_073650 [Parasponia andersonii]